MFGGIFRGKASPLHALWPQHLRNLPLKTLQWSQSCQLSTLQTNNKAKKQPAIEKELRTLFIHCQGQKINAKLEVKISQAAKKAKRIG